MFPLFCPFLPFLCSNIQDNVFLINCIGIDTFLKYLLLINLSLSKGPPLILVSSIQPTHAAPACCITKYKQRIIRVSRISPDSGEQPRGYRVVTIASLQTHSLVAFFL